jgi:methylenetetrahydrofolate reductase (NADPH)
LRGDPPQGKDEWEAVEGGFVHGIDLVKHIRREYGDYFDIAVAGFPQHMTLPPEELDNEIRWLKEKIDAGVSFIFTQMFYDVQLFIDWVKAIRAAGITVPIVPGIAPIQTWNGFQRATSLAKIAIPQDFLDVLEPVKNNDEKVREIGTKLVADMCRTILDADIGVRGLHFYTMNLERGTKMLLEELGLVPRIETVKPLPWRQVCLSLQIFFRSLNERFLVSDPQQTTRNNSPNLLGQQDEVLYLSHRKLGRISQRSFRRLTQPGLR